MLDKPVSQKLPVARCYGMYVMNGNNVDVLAPVLGSQGKRAMPISNPCAQYNTLQSTTFDHSTRGSDGLAEDATGGSDSNNASKGGDCLIGTIVG